MFPIYTLMAANYSAEMSIAMLVVSFAVLGAVFGIDVGPLGGRMIENVPDSERAGASSILSFIMYFGSASGTKVGIVVRLRPRDRENDIPIPPFRDLHGRVRRRK